MIGYNVKCKKCNVAYPNKMVKHGICDNCRRKNNKEINGGIK